MPGGGCRCTPSRSGGRAKQARGNLERGARCPSVLFTGLAVGRRRCARFYPRVRERRSDAPTILLCRAFSLRFLSFPKGYALRREPSASSGRRAAFATHPAQVLQRSAGRNCSWWCGRWLYTRGSSLSGAALGRSFASQCRPTKSRRPPVWSGNDGFAHFERRRASYEVCDLLTSIAPRRKHGRASPRPECCGQTASNYFKKVSRGGAKTADTNGTSSGSWKLGALAQHARRVAVVLVPALHEGADHGLRPLWVDVAARAL